MSQGLKIGDYWYYLTESGRRLQSEFRQKGKDWYYYDALGRMLQDVDTSIDGYRYIFQSSGAVYRGLLEEDGKIIGFDTKGRQAFDAGVEDNGYWYYFDSQGNMVKNAWRTKDGGRYYYQADGTLAVNKGMKVDGYWYYFTASGRMHTGWRDKGGDSYYYDSNGHLVVGCTILIDGVQYEFDSNGRWVNKIAQKIEELKLYTYVPYVSGGNTPAGWDCSGFTQWAIGYLGASIPRVSYDQAVAGRWVNPWDPSSWKPGDLLVYSSEIAASHVAIYLGDGMLMHSLNERYGTLIQSVEYYEWWDTGTTLTGVRRFL